MENNDTVAIFIPPPNPTAGNRSEQKGPVEPGQDNGYIARKDFPEGFIFGSATASFQVEGAYATGGRGLSIWDDFSLRNPKKIADGSNGNIACDMYHRYKEDIQTMKKMGFDAYRFSISWSRILPGGRRSAGINREGIDYYNNVINTLIANEIKPFVTLFHFDLPDCLEKEYGGFLDKKIKDDFREYVELCFWEFGDRVKMWATLNEPWTYAVHGYVNGYFPPGKKLPAPIHDPHKHLRKVPCHRTSHVQPIIEDDDYVKADPKETYIVTRNLLLAHAEAAYSYKTKFQKFQEGQIGIVLNSQWYEALGEHSEADKTAASRAVDFMLGWYLDPILHGQYPETMIDNSEENLAYFTPQESEMLKNSIDYLGLNYYTTQYVSDDQYPHPEKGYYVDQKAEFVNKRHGKDIGDLAPGSMWLYSVPSGIYKVLKHLKDRYPSLKEIYITENGCSESNDPKITAAKACEDDFRKKYYQDHLANVSKVIKDWGVNVKGYFAWSWCDNFEWNTGYTSRFGLMYTDYMNNQTRYPKNSALWFTEFLKTKWQPFVEVAGGKRSIEQSGEDEPQQKKLKIVEANS